YEWLREYVNTKIRAENLSSLLTMAGHEVEAIDERAGDFIFEMEITPNRPDCLCHLGIAREASAIMGKKLKLPKTVLPKKKDNRQVKIKIEDGIGCPRYSGRIISGIKVGPSPKWLIKRIESMGLRPVNNIVDITNFVLFETGQPLHAFDLDKLKENTVVVRRAKRGEKILTIEGSEKELNPSMLVIADSARPIAIAGIMGGKNTEVTAETKNILLESAYFNPAVIRSGALSLGLGTDSSYRFERGVDLEGVVSASDRAASLICGAAKGELGNIIDAGKKNKKRDPIILRPAQLNKLLGTKISSRRIREILQKLEFTCKGLSSMEVTPPSFRGDITREADLIEEVARIYGYEKIDSHPAAVIATDEEPGPKDVMKKTKITKDALVSLGFNEVITYSLISKQAASNAEIADGGTIEIRNPLSREQEIMRRSLLPGIIKAVSYNISRQIQDIKLFELSSIYFTKEGCYIEEPCLALAQHEKAQKSKKDHLSCLLFKLKRAVAALSEKLAIKDMGFDRTTHPVFEPGETLMVLSGNVMLGSLGKIKPGILEKFDIKTELYAAELNFSAIIENSNLNRFYSALPRFPFSYRDISFAIDNKISYKEIAGLVKSTGGLFIEEIELLSEYRGEHIPKGRRALAVRVVYRSKEKTLTEEEVNAADSAIRQNLTKIFAASLR
ncbi:MAG: phenylalanine--tRNA ligase subunit beta, partial [Candidatus Omnitrophota bacterium]